MWLVTGLICVAIGAVGVVVPLLPTTPFLLIAAFAFAKSSRRLTKWLHEHRTFGPLIDNWRRYGAISRSAKVMSILAMIAVVAVSVYFEVPFYVIVIQVLTLGISAAFVLTRPLPPG